jgi:glycosyltransferase involved in cell wall biosynthesis
VSDYLMMRQMNGSLLEKSVSKGRLKIMFLITEDWYFLSHRLALARACRDLGWEVIVATYVDDRGAEIEREGFRLISLRMRRSDRAPWKELPAIFELARLMRRERPDILFQVGLKPIIYGGLISLLARPPAVVNLFAGLGYIFTSVGFRVKCARAAIVALLRVIFRCSRAWVIVQNQQDAKALVSSGLISSDRVDIIAGSGVDLERFAPTPEPPEPIKVTVVSRMLKDKGIQEIVLASRELKRRGKQITIRLVGAPDPDNPSSLTEETLRQWHREGCIEWLGQRDDIPAVWAESHIAVLPSYREGMPKSLLEAAACGRPIVATDVPGCNELVRDGVSGILVPPRDWIKLADAIEKLAAMPALRANLGKGARAAVEDGLDEKTVVHRTLNVFKRALDLPVRQRLDPADKFLD